MISYVKFSTKQKFMKNRCMYESELLQLFPSTKISLSTYVSVLPSTTKARCFWST